MSIGRVIPGGESGPLKAIVEDCGLLLASFGPCTEKLPGCYVKASQKRSWVCSKLSSIVEVAPRSGYWRFKSLSKHAWVFRGVSWYRSCTCLGSD